MTISQKERQNLIFLLGKGLEYSQISRQTGFCYRTILRWLTHRNIGKRFEQTGTMYQLKGAGRPLSTTLADGMSILEMAEENPTIILKDIGNSLETKFLARQFTAD